MSDRMHPVSRNRAKRERVCVRKRAWTSLAAAERVVATAASRGVHLRPYACPVCPRFHLTSVAAPAAPCEPHEREAMPGPAATPCRRCRWRVPTRRIVKCVHPLQSSSGMLSTHELVHDPAYAPDWCPLRWIHGPEAAA